MPLPFVALYGRFNHKMKPAKVINVSSVLAHFTKEHNLILPKERQLDDLFPNKLEGKKFLQIQLANGRKVNILNDTYHFDIQIDLLSNDKPIVVVYSVFINPLSNWRAIVSGQLADVRSYGLLGDCSLYIHITDIHQTKGVLAFIRKKAGADAIITQSFTNQYEYPAIKLLHDLATQQPGKVFMYFHTRGMSYNIKKRKRQERALLSGTFSHWRKSVQALEDPSINKAGLFPAVESSVWGGWVWFNFFIAKGSYLSLCEVPVVTTNRYYYESWLSSYNGTVSIYDCYSSFTNKQENFTQQQAADNLEVCINNYIAQRKSENFIYRLRLPWQKK